MFSNGLATSRILMTFGGGELTLGQEVAMPTRATQRYERCDADAERLLRLATDPLVQSLQNLQRVIKKATFSAGAFFGPRGACSLRVLGAPTIPYSVQHQAIRRLPHRGSRHRATRTSPRATAALSTARPSCRCSGGEQADRVRCVITPALLPGGGSKRIAARAASGEVASSPP